MAEDRREEEIVRQVASRAIRRLDLLEGVLLVGAALLAVVAGWLGAWLVTSVAPVDFRVTWVALSAVFFGVPAFVAWWSNRE